MKPIVLVIDPDDPRSSFEQWWTGMQQAIEMSELEASREHTQPRR